MTRGRGRFGRGGRGGFQGSRKRKSGEAEDRSVNAVVCATGQRSPRVEGSSPSYASLFPRYFASPVAADDKRCALIESLIQFLESEPARDLVARLLCASSVTMHSISIPIEWKDICDAVAVLEDAMLHAPSQALACLEIAFHDLIQRQRSPEPVPRTELIDAVRVRLHGYTSDVNMFESTVGSIKADKVGKIVAIRGTVTKVSPAKAIYTSMNFVCSKCHTSASVRFEDGIYGPPLGCSMALCGGRHFKANPKESRCQDWQQIHIQPLQTDKKSYELETSASLVQIELTDDLVESCAPGDMVTATGIVKVIDAGDKQQPRNRLFLPYVSAISIRRADDLAGSGRDGDKIVAVPRGVSFLPPAMAGFTARDIAFVQKYASRCRGRSLEMLVASIAPSIFGMNTIKAGLVLSLFGGIHGSGDSTAMSTVASTGSNRLHVRGDIHCLLVGDPGLGKSRLLKAIAGAAPRGVYVCGPSASAAGLTLSVSKSDGEFSLEAGAIVAADRGICCVDEFDKLASEHTSLLGVMEQQEVSIAKAGLVASLPARTSIVAAANPVEGHYNKSMSLSKNLKMSPALFSRFDLVFLMLDKPSKSADKKLASHIIGDKSMDDGDNFVTQALMTQQTSLRHRLGEATKGPNVNPSELLPPQLIKKLVAYARQYVHPKLSDEAKEIIKEFYLKLRQRAAGDATSPAVTHRLLESLVRLSEARARVELRDNVTAGDALDAIEIVKDTVNGSLCEGPDTIIFNNVNQKKGARGGGRGRFNQERDRFISAVRRFCQRNESKEVMINDLFSIADSIELNVDDTVGFLEYLVELCFFLKKPNGLFILL
jgi:DNA helicase MCM8